MNPFNAIGELVLGLIKARRLQAWCSLVFELAFSAVVSFLYVCGTALVAGQPAPVAIGAGMVMAATSCMLVYRRSPATRGMTVALPGEEANTELNSSMQVVQK